MAAWLADGENVRDIARATGLTEGAIYWHLKQIYRKLPISRQVDLTTMSPTLPILAVTGRCLASSTSAAQRQLFLPVSDGCSFDDAPFGGRCCGF